MWWEWEDNDKVRQDAWNRGLLVGTVSASIITSLIWIVLLILAGSW